jgi:protein-L-isoaspartate(D-aspartate) O-methyltransferase
MDWQREHRRQMPGVIGLLATMLAMFVVLVMIVAFRHWAGQQAADAFRPDPPDAAAEPLVRASGDVADTDTTEPAAVPIPTEPAVQSPLLADEAEHFRIARQQMVEHHLRRRDITDRHVLEVMGRLPRQLFVPEELRHSAYDDRPLPIGHNQTISQPYIVALMTQAARPTKQCRALDVGTGSGYQAAVLAELCREVFCIEILKPLADEARKRLAALGYRNITVRHGDGYRGWPENSPFDVIIVAAAPDHVPSPLVEQLAPGGRLVIPVGKGFNQDLLLIEKDRQGHVHRRTIAPVLFVPMTGEAVDKGPG